MPALLTLVKFHVACAYTFHGYFELLKIQPNVNNLQQYVDEVTKKEKLLDTKEKILEAHREGMKLSWRELANAVDGSRVF